MSKKHRPASSIGANVPSLYRPLNNEEIRTRALKEQKAALIKMGFITAPVKREPDIWEWANLNSHGAVKAFTRSEAKARIKQTLGLPKGKRLPAGVIIAKVVKDDE